MNITKSSKGKEIIDMEKEIQNLSLKVETKAVTELEFDAIGTKITDVDGILYAIKE